jgi:hypothetical protein
MEWKYDFKMKMSNVKFLFKSLGVAFYLLWQFYIILKVTTYIPEVTWSAPIYLFTTYSILQCWGWNPGPCTW